MDFEFDPAKSDRNLHDRGFGFGFASRIFDGHPLVFIDDRIDYGEIRKIAIGPIDGKLFKVAFTDRGGIRRIISAHRASRQETRLWHSSE